MKTTSSFLDLPQSGIEEECMTWQKIKKIL